MRIPCMFFFIVDYKECHLAAVHLEIDEAERALSPPETAEYQGLAVWCFHESI